MAVNPNPPAAPAAEPQSAPAAAPVATPQTDPTPAQVESKSVVASLSKDIDDLWAQAEGKAPRPETPAPQADPEPASAVAETPAPEPVVAEAPKTDDTPPAAVDQATLEQQAYERAKADFERNQAAERSAQERVTAEAQYQREVTAYTGQDADYEAVNRALRQAIATGDDSVLSDLDVLLPDGRKVSQVKGGQKGLTQEEAASVLTAWDLARRHQATVGDSYVKRIIGFWNTEVESTLAHPDVDAAAITKHESPAKQMQAVIDSVSARVTKRLTDAHTAEIKSRDERIAAQEQRIESLLNERGNLTSQQIAAGAATPDRPGVAGAPPQIELSPERLHEMDTNEAFKSGYIDRALRAIEGGVPARRRRTG